MRLIASISLYYRYLDRHYTIAALLLPSWLYHADVQLPQLPLGTRGRRAHEQVLGVLGHRKRDDLAKVGLLRQEHHDPVDPWRQPSVRWRSVPERPEHSAEP